MEKLGAPQTPAEDAVLCTPAFPFKDQEPISPKIALTNYMIKMNLINLPIVVSIALRYNKHLTPSYSKHVVGSERSFVCS